MRNTKKHPLLRLCLAAAMLLSLAPLQAFADDSTTTVDTAAKDLGANTEIYAVTQTPGSDYPYYGAKNEPMSGVYYGRTCEGGTLPNGNYGLVNQSQMADESIVGFYFDITQSYSLEYWSYIFGPALEDGKRAFLVYINFKGEGSDCASFAGGAYDSKLNETFSYLNTLSNPVFVRIGGEVNVWNNAATPESYIAAYRHVADLARARAPRAALVFSPNFSSAYRVDMDSFYPGDAYVDWIGVSLYYNLYHATISDPDMAAFLGVGQYGDPMLNVQQCVNLSRLHKKPLMVTEGGAGNSFNGQDISAWASERMQKAYAFLPMVYPEVKGIVSSDYHYSWAPTSYTFYNHPTMTAAYRKAVSNSPAYLKSVGDDAGYYTKVSAFTGPWEGQMRFDAYTYSPTKLTATWAVDGQTRATAADYPYTFNLDASALSGGDHTLTVTFSNGATKTHSFKIAGGATDPVVPEEPSNPDDGYTQGLAYASTQSVTVDGKAVEFQMYALMDGNGNGTNYIKLRDMAYILNGTEAQFSVGYDNATKKIALASGESYEASGAEMKTPYSGDRAYTGRDQSVLVDGDAVSMFAITLLDDQGGGYTYFKLRDLGEALGFNVGWSKDQGVFIETDRPYEG
jgi:hypothetical protein